MSVNWVMLKEDGSGFVPLSREKVLYKSPARTTIVVRTPNSFPGREPFNISSTSGGTVYVTNQRVVYLPTAQSKDFQSFSSPILNLLDSRVNAPLFGANSWEAVLRPVAGGGIPAEQAYVEVKLTFKDGGAYDFHRIFEEVKERTTHAVDSARAQGRGADLSDVPLEQLPAYEATAQQNGGVAPVPAPAPASNPAATSSTASSNTAPQASPPQEPPPGYEETQSASVMQSLEESIRRRNT